MITLVYSLYRKDGLSREEFVRYWLDEHAAFGAKLPHVLSYRIMPVTNAADVLGLEADGFVLLEFESTEDMEACLSSPEMATAGKDAANFARHFELYAVESHRII